ncbi:MAG TPA: glycosyltransferase [Polyangia bacterium]|nr:glycosyltransferase [Polyangia bacterium]
MSIGSRAAASQAPSKRHKVLLFIPNLQQGGAERQILELMTRLPARFEPTLCLYEDVVHYREYLPDGEPRHVLGERRMGPRGLRKLVEVLREEKPDILHSYRDKANFWARLATRRAAVPVVVTAVRSRAMHVVHLLTEQWLSQKSDRIIANSEGVRRELVELAGVAPEKVQLLHNFIDLERFRPPTNDERAAARAKWGLGANEIALLLPGRVGVQKHQIGLALALARLRRAGRLPANVRVMLAGRNRDRVYSAVLPRVLELLGLTEAVRFLGTVSEMLSLYHAADALVMPSLYEGLPNAVLEAHACGLPAVVSHAANIDRIVVDGVSGFEAPTFDHDALAEALARMVAAGPDERRAMGARGRAHVAETFSVERILEETVRLYDDLLAAKGLADPSERSEALPRGASAGGAGPSQGPASPKGLA